MTEKEMYRHIGEELEKQEQIINELCEWCERYSATYFGYPKISKNFLKNAEIEEEESI